MIEEGVIIDYDRLTHKREGYVIKPSIIDSTVLIRTGTIIYIGCKIGKHSHIAHNCVIREFTEIGDYSSIGNGVCTEGYTKIGNYVNIHTQVHITANAVIEDYVFMAPLSGCVNGRRVGWHRPWIKRVEIGPTIGRGSVIGFGAKILPQVKLGKNVIVGAQSLVTKDVPDNKVVMGVPARIKMDTPEEYIIPDDYDPMEYIRGNENLRRV